MGREGAVVNVKPGRARNHLVPHKMASYPNEHRLAEAAAKRETWDEAVVKEASEDAAAKVRRDVFSLDVFSFPPPARPAHPGRVDE